MRIVIAAALSFALCIPATADAVVDELSRRSLVPVEDLVDYLDNCDRDQVSMNFCAFRDAVDADLRLDQVIEAEKADLSAEEAKALDAEIEQWREDMAAECNRQADEEAEGGSMRPAVYSLCAADETEKRIKQLSK